MTYTQFEQVISDVANRHQALDFRIGNEADGGLLVVVTNPTGQLRMPLAQSHRFDVPNAEPADLVDKLDDLIKVVTGP